MLSKPAGADTSEDFTAHWSAAKRDMRHVLELKYTKPDDPDTDPEDTLKAIER